MIAVYPLASIYRFFFGIPKISSIRVVTIIFSQKVLNLSKIAPFYQLQVGFCGKTADGSLQTKKYEKMKTIQGYISR